MNRHPYPTDLTDEQWKIIAPMIPPAKPGGRPRTTDMREAVNAIMYLLRTGCAWRLLPGAFPSWYSVYGFFRSWKKDGVWQRIHDSLRERVRRKAGRNTCPSAAIIDSQSVKTTEKGGLRGATTRARK